MLRAQSPCLHRQTSHYRLNYLPILPSQCHHPGPMQPGLPSPQLLNTSSKTWAGSAWVLHSDSDFSSPGSSPPKLDDWKKSHLVMTLTTSMCILLLIKHLSIQTAQRITKYQLPQVHHLDLAILLYWIQIFLRNRQSKYMKALNSLCLYLDVTTFLNVSFIVIFFNIFSE